MKSISICTCLIGAVAVLSALAAKAQEPVSIESLLSEMVDRDNVARYPKADFRLKQSSSYDRSSKTPDDPKGWFSNIDRNTSDEHVNFVRTETNNGRKEWVVMEDEGPGAIVRFWVPWQNQLKPGTDIVIRFYLDGASEPTIQGNMFDLFQGKGMVPFPLAHESLRSAVSFFPIPYAKSCKVTMSDHPFFFQFTYRKYPDGTPAKTFTMKEFKAAKPLIDQTCKLLQTPSSGTRQEFRVPGGPKVLTTSATLQANEETALQLPDGVAAIRNLSVRLGSYEDANVTRHVVLKISFDEKETVWCPIGDFFGCGIGLNPFQGWYRTVDSDGTMTCLWVMPYRYDAKVSIVNLGDEPVEVELSAGVGDWKWDSSSMYFHSGWRGQYPVPTRPYSDWNYVTLKGRGVYVGDTLTIMNPVERWWGEGDEKIFVDGETFPSIFGTGTEDYYAYSWGGRSTDFYEHPFHAQTFSHQYNKLNRKPKIDEKNTQGFSTETRTRALDTMPFATSLQLDMEVWSWTDCKMGYGVGVYWYGDADTTSNRKPEPVAVLNVPPLPEMTPSVVPGPVKQTPKPASTLMNAVEVETKNIISRSEKIVLKPQNLKALKLKGSWNLDNHLLFKGAKVGDVVELRIPASSPSAQMLVLHATKSRDFGILRFTINGKPTGADVDLYAAKPVPSGKIVLGNFEPVDSAYVLRVEVVGKNGKSTGTLFGLDCVVIERAKQ